jgi:hypothetical protein
VNVFEGDDGLDGLANSATRSQREIKSEAIALQSTMVSDALVGMIGWRREEVSTVSVSPPIVADGEGYLLTNDPGYSLYAPNSLHEEFNDTLRAWSLVAKAPESWVHRLPVLSGISLFTGASDNFNPPDSTSVDVFGRQLAPPSGQTRDYGMNLSFLDGKINLRIDHYETNEDGVVNTDTTAAASAIISDYESAYNSVRSGFNADSGNGFPAGFVAPPQALLSLYHVQINNGTISASNPGVADTSNYVSQGTEFELQANAFHGLSLEFNLDREGAVRSNSGQALGRLLFDTPLADGNSLAADWTNSSAARIALASGGIGLVSSSNSLNTVFTTGVLAPYFFAIAKDGGPVQELRKWRANTVANYRFESGPLKGWGLGGAARWEDRVAIGYGATTGPGGVAIYNANAPIWGPEAWHYDGWLSYRRSIWRNIGLTVQLNVRNLLGNQGLIPVVAQPDGSIAIWRIGQPRTFTLSTTFEF